MKGEMENKFKGQEPEKKSSIFTFIEDNLKMMALFEDGFPVRFMPYVFFMIGIGIFYIWNSHYADRNLRKVEKLQREVDELRVEYTTLQSSFMFASKQSEVAKRVEKIGLFESSEPPYKIVVKKGEY